MYFCEVGLTTTF